LLASIPLARSDVYITSIVQDRPPDNRDPKPEELALYSPILQSVIDLITPRVIVTLGRFSMRYVLERYRAPEKDDPINALHGKVISVHADFGPLTIIPQYHPAFALYNGSKRSILEADFQQILSFI
jgi:DNA polymerase